MISAEVYLWGTRIGVVAQEDINSIPLFNYDDKFLKSRIEVSPIAMPLSKQVYSFSGLNKESFYGLPGLLADSLPDKFGTKLIERYLAEQGRELKSLTAVERLCYVGNRGMGALEYVPAIGYSKGGDGSIDINLLVKLASDILAERKSLHISANSDAMRQIIRIGTSAGGARAKAVVAWNESTNDIRSGQIDAGSGYGYWLIKFDGIENNKDKGDKVDGPTFTRIEYAYALMAQAAKIEMKECRLYRESGHYHFMTRRFDRELDTGKKIHMQTLGALAHFDYNSPGAYSYEQVAQILYQLGMGQKEVEELFRRMVFNIFARNQDDHVKNISFLMNTKGVWSLAPAYDLTFAYEPNNYWLSRHQMSMQGKVNRFKKEDFFACGKQMNISKRKMERIIEEVRSAVVNWDSYAEQAYLDEKVAKEIQEQFECI
ncbi:MAG: type II toxin-antitoxin system HipA family toxin [Faecalimonas sp.]|nr:type II toxin-antitoxin system HipA family toxin [Faecalimonas sp.]